MPRLKRRWSVAVTGVFVLAASQLILLLRQGDSSSKTKQASRFPTRSQLLRAESRYHNLSSYTNQTPPLSLDWEPPPLPVHQNADAASVCFAWTQNTDLWWTHHPTYRIQSENNTHFCFGPRRLQQAKFFQTLYEIQFQGDCSRVTTKKMWSDGWGADLRNVLDGLIHARRTKLPFQIDRTPWHYAAAQDVSRPVCPTMSLGCYFLPLSSCAPRPRQLPERADYWHGVPGFFNSRYYYEYLTRPQQWLRKRVYDYTATLSLTVPCVTMHVRRGDSVLGGEETSQREYRSIHEYVSPIRNDPKNILLLTDDANAIAEAKRQYPAYNWMYFDRRRYRGSEGGWERHLPSDDPALEVVVILSEFRLATQCGTLVHTASNFGQLLYAEMKKVNRTVRRVNLG
jgi:hypothetical protein